jgi:hypothetical protein
MPAIGAGRHAVKVVNHQLGKSSTGTAHVAVLFEDPEGGRITWYGYLTDAALERTIASLRILGWDPTKHDGRIDSLHNSGLLVDAEAEVVVEMETYNGETRPKVKWVNEVGGGMGEGMPAEEALSFASSLRQKILSAQPPKPNSRPGPARQPAGVGADTDGVDDDLPF